MTFLLELVAEIFLQLFVEGLLELGWRRIERVRWSEFPVLVALLWGVLGAVMGVSSHVLWPQQLLAAPWLRIANLVVTPIAVGLCVGALAALRASRPLRRMRLADVARGFAFALAMALARFLLGGP